MPGVASLDAFRRAVAEFTVADPGLVIEPAALAAARQSLDSSGLLLLGEVRGVRENPLLVRAFMQALELTSVALEWPEGFTPGIRAFLASGTLAGHWWLRGGDGRITAGHLAVLAERAAAGALELILSGGVVGADWSWSQRDEAMAPPGARTLVVAGNARTAASLIELGVPMGARLAGQRSGVREIQIRYRGGNYCDGGPRQFSRYTGPEGLIRLHQDDGGLFLDLPEAAEAVVPQRPHPWSGLFWSERAMARAPGLALCSRRETRLPVITAPRCGPCLVLQRPEHPHTGGTLRDVPREMPGNAPGAGPARLPARPDGQNAAPRRGYGQPSESTAFCISAQRSSPARMLHMMNCDDANCLPRPCRIDHVPGSRVR